MTDLHSLLKRRIAQANPGRKLLMVRAEFHRTSENGIHIVLEAEEKDKAVVGQIVVPNNLIPVFIREKPSNALDKVFKL